MIEIIGWVHPDIEAGLRLETVLKKVKPDIIGVEITDLRLNDLDLNIPHPSEVIEEAKKNAVTLSGLLSKDRDMFEFYQNRYFQLYGTRLGYLELGNAIAADMTVDILTPHPIRVAEDYSKEHPGVEIKFIDLPEKSREQLAKERKNRDELLGQLGDLRGDSDLGISELLHAIRTGVDAILQLHQAGIVCFYSRQFVDSEFSEPFQPGYDHGQNPFNEKVYDPRRNEYMANTLKRLTERGSVLVLAGMLHLSQIEQHLAGFPHDIKTLLDYCPQTGLVIA